MNISIIIAIYNRPDELYDLLESLHHQTDTDFEVVVIDDGSSVSLLPLIDVFREKLRLVYKKQENTGPGYARNHGTRLAKGDYFIFIDSDCIVPKDYISIVKTRLAQNYTDAFGGPDAAHTSFNSLQKAISFSMTSILTTGGVRGKKTSVGKFQPRSFNMGVSRKAFEKVGGFSELRIGEDPDLSMTLWEHGFDTQLIESAEVFHKRRSSLKSFSKQVFQFGIARPILFKRHPKYIKLSFFAPTFFLFFSLFSISCGLWYPFFALPLAVYFLMIFGWSLWLNKSIKVALLSIVTTAIQWYSYGYGFLISFVRILIFKQNPSEVFSSHYYTKN